MIVKKKLDDEILHKINEKYKKCSNDINCPYGLCKIFFNFKLPYPCIKYNEIYMCELACRYEKA